MKIAIGGIAVAVVAIAIEGAIALVLYWRSGPCGARTTCFADVSVSGEVYAKGDNDYPFTVQQRP